MDKNGTLRGHGPAISILVAGIVASVVAFVTVRESVRSDVDEAFRSQAEAYVDIIIKGFTHAFIVVESVGALYDSSVYVSGRQFADFTAPLLERFPTISALGWAPQVPHAGRAGFEQAARRAFPAFRITERNKQGLLVSATERDTYYPLYYLAPSAGNEAARGFDLYSESVRRAAIDLAREGGKTVCSGRISLVQGQSDQYSVLLAHPVFGNAVNATDPDRSSGVASAVYRIGDGVKSALLKTRPAGLNVWIFDRSGPPGEQFLYFHRSRALTAKPNENESIPPADARQYLREFNFGGRKFELILSPAAGYFDLRVGYAAWAVLLAGLGFSGLLVAYLELVRNRAQELVRGQKALEREINERKKAEQRLFEANRHLEILSQEDPLTGLANRRHFDAYFEKEWRRAVRYGTSLSLLVGDVDHFKSYNDRYGHVAGDECLRKIAKTVSGALDRPGDLAARYGGEEIAVVLPSTSESGAYELAEKIRLAVATMEIGQQEDREPRVVTLSIGCGTLTPTRSSSMEGFFRAVDAALYRAKQQGRNRTVLVETSD